MERKIKSMLVMLYLIMIFSSLVYMLFYEFYKDLLIYLILYFGLILIYFLKNKGKVVCMKSLYILMYSLMFGLSPFFYVLNNNSLTISEINISNLYPMCILGLIALLLGMCFPIKNRNTIEKINYDNLHYHYFISIILILISTIFNFYYIYINKSLFFGGNLESSRIDALANNGVIILLCSLNLLGNCMLFDYYCKTGKKKVLLCASVIIMFIIYIIRGSRTPLLRFFLVSVLMYNLKNKIKFKSILRLFIVALFLMSGLQVIRTTISGGTLTILSSLLSNLQVGSINFSYIYSRFPKFINFQYGYTFLINIKMMLPGNDPDFTLWLKNILDLNFSGGGITPTLFGEGYINFGIIGAILECFIMGIFSKMFDFSYENNSIRTFWSVYFSVITIDAFRGGIANIEINILFTLFIYFIYYLFYKKSVKDGV